MQIETVKVSSLIPDPANVRKHPEKNLLAIKGSLARFGQQKPIVVNHKNIVVAGNGTLEAAKSLGWTEIKIVRSDLSGSMATAFAIADNRTTDLSTFDQTALAIQIGSLKGDGFDLGDLGFDHDDVMELELLIGELGGDSDKDKKDDAEVKFSEHIGESNNYVLLLFKKDIDWLQAVDHFQVQQRKEVRTGRIGLGRILDGADYLRRIVNV